MTRPADDDATAATLAEGSRKTETVRHRGDAHEQVIDRVAHEEPLEIQIEGESIAVLMRTPGHDLELVAGFLRTEGVLAPGEEPASIHHGSVDDENENVVRVSLPEGARLDAERLRRNVFAASSCGVCGKATREAVLQRAPPLDDPASFTPAFFRGLPERLRRGQTLFTETGGLHAAALFAPDGMLRVLREDVGRHNAVDKVIGWATRSGAEPLTGHALLVSGRVSFEIVQKALAARIPAIAAISAPTSLAVELATEGAVVVGAFLRGDGFNTYGATHRVRA